MSADQDLTLLHLAAELGALLQARSWRVTTAESCTGGGVANAITSVSGSSGWFDMGFVTYSNRAKIQLLQVDEQVLSSCGAVSLEVAESMARGAKSQANANLSVAVTGIAGPTGGTAQKPVGTVCFGWVWGDDQRRTDCYTFEGDREAIRRQAVVTALREMVRIAKTTV